MEIASRLDWPQWLTRRETADYLRIEYGIRFGPAALANAAVKGTGPPFQKQNGKLVSYRRPDVDQWASTRMSRRVISTSELRKPAPSDRNAREPEAA